ncbi:MAG: gyrase subunit A protein, partial [Parcubacteria group bacterium GW2011_GWB2_40_8]
MKDFSASWRKSLFRGIVLVSYEKIRSQKSGKESIIVTELPYQVNKATLQERIAELVRDEKIKDISAIRDESDRDG